MEVSSISRNSIEEGNNDINNNNKISGDFSHVSLRNHSDIHQDHNASSDAQISRVRLKLTITPEFCNLVNISLAHTKAQENRSLDNILSQPETEKCRASNFSASSLTIGTWQIVSQREGDLVVKFYYQKKKIVWEILNGDLKSKMEIPFSNIDAIKATIRDNEPGELKIELKYPPDFAVEVQPKPRKHTIWNVNANDFTENQALFCRRHVVTCQPGALEKHYDLLLQYDSRLLELSQKPYPTDDFPIFSLVDAINFNISSQCNSCGGSPVDPLVQRCYSCSNGSFESNVPQMPGFNPNDGNYVNGASNWNHMSNNEENIFLPQGQEVISPPSILASSPKIYLGTNNLHPLLEQSWVTTREDNIGVNHSTVVDDVSPVLAKRRLRENVSHPSF